MAYSLSPLLKPRFFVNATNKPLVGGKLYTYLAETTTPATTYSNDTGTPNTNPIILVKFLSPRETNISFADINVIHFTS